MEYITGFLALAFTAVFALSALTRGRTWAAKSRLDLAFAGADALVVLCGARLLMPWASVSPLLWLIPIAIFAAAVAGAVLRWRSLPNLRPDKSRRSVIIWSIVHVVVLTGLLFVLLG